MVLNRSDMPHVGGARVYEGRSQGGTNISLFFVDVPPGCGPRLHRHPYKEVFVVHEGQAKFTIGTASVDIAAGEIVIVEAGIPHKFVNSGKGRLLQTDIHLRSEFETEWLES